MSRQARKALWAEQKRELWQRWRQGESIAAIARSLERSPDTIRTKLEARGGIVPAHRTRSLRVLSLAEREAISRGLAQGHSQRWIASELGRAPSTIGREIARHGGRQVYRADHADRRAWHRARRPKSCRLVCCRPLQRMVADKLQKNWSPEQIAGWLKLEHPDNSAMQVSHETIYRSLFIQARGALKKALLEHLRTHRLLRRSQRTATQPEQRGKILDAVCLSERPAEAQDRAVPGHWEGDLLAGAGNTHIATLVERHSRFTMLVKVPSKQTAQVVPALARHIRRLPASLRRSLTWDRGKELSRHKALTMATNMQVYFCDPHSPWQRGSNENTNGLLRQYFPKGTDLSHYTQAQLNRVARELNERPRKTLGFITPAQKLAAAVAMTG